MKRNGKTYAFIGLERVSLIVVFDITNPKRPKFVEVAQNNPANVSTESLFKTGMQGDMDPEGLFASGRLSKLFVGGSVSSTVTTYDIVN